MVMEQHGHNDSIYHLLLVCRMVAVQFGNPDITSWTNGDYLRLSGILSRHTAIQLSPSTLKRIFGKLKTPQRYYPQKATRDGLARYVGFRDWDDFLDQHPRPAVEELPDEETLPPATVAKEEQPTLWMSPLLIVLLALLGVSLMAGWWWYAHRPANQEDLSGVRLVCNNPVGGNPHSAVFRLQVPASFRGDSSLFCVAFGDKEMKYPMLPGAVMTHYYETPGRFYVTLLYNTQVLDTVPVYLTSTGWSATAYSLLDTTRVYPLPDPAFGPRGMAVTAAAVHDAGMDTLHTFFVDFTNTHPFDITADNLDLAARLHTSAPRPGVRCSQVMLTLFGEKARHELLLLKPGCASWVHLRFSEKLLDGRQEDLSKVGANLEAGGEVHLRIVNRQASLYINDKLLYKVAYRQPLGQLYGFRISFAGIGGIENFHITGLDGRAVVAYGK